MKNRQCNSGREGEGREGKKVRVCCGVRVGGSQIFEQWSYQNVYVLSPMCSCKLCLNSHVTSNFTCRLLLRTNSLCFTTIKSFNPSVSNALPKCRAVTPFLFPSQYHCVVWESALPQKFCCVNLVFKGSVSLGESSDLNGSFHSLFLWSVNGSICVWLRHKIWVRTNPRRRFLPVVATTHDMWFTHKVALFVSAVFVLWYHRFLLNWWMASFRESPCWCAKVAFPTILCTVGIRCSVGAWSMFQPSDSAIVKSLLLNGSAMLALLGTRLSIWVNWCRLCHAQCDPIRLLRGWCFPDPLLMACVAGSLSQSCTYGLVSRGCINTGVMMAAHASKKYIYALLLAKCCSIFRGTDPWTMVGFFPGGKITAAQPLVWS